MHLFIPPFIKRYYRSISAALLILFLSTFTSGGVDSDSWFNFPHMDEVAHFVLYFFLGFILFIDFASNRKFSYRIVIAILVFAAFYGALIEIIQLYIPGRSGDIYDFLFDLAGLLTGMLLYYLFRRIRY